LHRLIFFFDRSFFLDYLASGFLSRDYLLITFFVFDLSSALLLDWLFVLNIGFFLLCTLL